MIYFKALNRSEPGLPIINEGTVVRENQYVRLDRRTNDRKEVGEGREISHQSLSEHAHNLFLPIRHHFTSHIKYRLFPVADKNETRGSQHSKVNPVSHFVIQRRFKHGLGEKTSCLMNIYRAPFDTIE